MGYKNNNDSFKERMAETGIKIAINLATELGKVATKSIVNKISSHLENRDKCQYTTDFMDTRCTKTKTSKSGKPAKFSRIMFNPKKAEEKLAKAGEKWAKEGRRLNELRKDLAIRTEEINKARDSRIKELKTKEENRKSLENKAIGYKIADEFVLKNRIKYDTNSFKTLFHRIIK